MLAVVTSCAIGPDDDCFDDDDNPIACEPLADSGEVADTPELPEDIAIVSDDAVAGPDDLDGLADEAMDVASELASPGSTAIDFGRTNNAERRELLPIGRTAGASRFVVMRLQPADLPRLQLGDTLRAAAELQVTTRCDIGQVAPGCNYSPHVRLQLVLSGSRDGTSPHAAGTLALSGVHRFDCTKDDHHCVKVINFDDASVTLRGDNALPCLTDGSCFVNLVAWAYHPDARSGGSDKLLLGANEGDFLANGKVEQDRGRIMAVRERGIGAGDVSLRVTPHDVRGGPITLASNGDSKRIYSHTLAGGADLRAGEKFRVWAEVDASSNGRVNLSLEMFLTSNRFDHNGGAIADTSPKAISEHNGTNCSPGNDCHLRKVTVFAIDRDIRGPVYVNIAAATEVPGPGSATTTIHDTGFIKALRYAR
jgi:hypothetical protein